jgi:hypothetical protein
LRKEFAKFANAFYHWLTDSRLDSRRLLSMDK